MVRRAGNHNTQANDQGYECEWAEFPAPERSHDEHGTNDHQAVIPGEGQERLEVGRRHDDVHMFALVKASEYSVVNEQ